MAFEHFAKPLQRVELNLPDAFTGHPNLPADFFERGAMIAVQAETTLDDRAMLIIEFEYPVIHDRQHVFGLSASHRLGRASRL